MAFKDDFIKGRALRSISAAWLNGIAKALNSLSIRFDPNAKVPRIEKPPMPAGRSGWAIVLPPYPKVSEGESSEQSSVPLPWQVVQEGSSWKLTTPRWNVGHGEFVERETQQLTPDASKPILRAKAEVRCRCENGLVDVVNSRFTWEFVDQHTAEEEDEPVYLRGISDEAASSNGTYFLYKTIGEFSTETSGEGDAAVTNITGFAQQHLGDIVLNLPRLIFRVVPGRVILDFENKRMYQQWNAVYCWPDVRGYDPRPIRYAGLATLDDWSDSGSASSIEIIDHVEDHVDGVLTLREDTVETE